MLSHPLILFPTPTTKTRHNSRKAAGTGRAKLLVILREVEKLILKKQM